MILYINKSAVAHLVENETWDRRVANSLLVLYYTLEYLSVLVCFVQFSLFLSLIQYNKLCIHVICHIVIKEPREDMNKQ